MDRNAHRWVFALRDGHDRLAAFSAGASADDLVHPSMCADWSVAQVLSHLGSGAEIGLSTVTNLPVDNAEVWGRWNAMHPAAMASSFVTADEQLVAWYEALSSEQLTILQVQLPFLPAPIDAADAARFRLSEITLHSLDVFAAFDPAATLVPDSAALLIDRLPMMAGFVGRFTSRDTRPAVDTTISVTTCEPERLRPRARRQHRPASGGRRRDCGRVDTARRGNAPTRRGAASTRPRGRGHDDRRTFVEPAAHRIPRLLTRRRSAATSDYPANSDATARRYH